MSHTSEAGLEQPTDSGVTEQHPAHDTRSQHSNSLNSFKSSSASRAAAKARATVEAARAAFVQREVELKMENLI